jgi:hypothetical protein
MPFCQKCGSPIAEGNLYCTQCGKPVSSGAAAPENNTFSAPLKSDNPNENIRFFVPYSNPYGLASYYLGMASLIPFLGIFTGIAAVISGIIGLVKAQKNPQIRGKIHAWAGILLGFFFALLYSLLSAHFI